jgi:hypothetical protein
VPPINSSIWAMFLCLAIHSTVQQSPISLLQCKRLSSKHHLRWKPSERFPRNVNFGSQTNLGNRHHGSAGMRCRMRKEQYPPTSGLRCVNQVVVVVCVWTTTAAAVERCHHHHRAQQERFPAFVTVCQVQQHRVGRNKSSIVAFFRSIRMGSKIRAHRGVF